MRFHTTTALMATLILGTTLATTAMAQQQDNTYSYSKSVTTINQPEYVQPEAGVVIDSTRTSTTTTTTRMGAAPTLQEEMPSRDYNHSYYTYSERYQAPALVYGGIEEPVIIDNGPELTPIRTLAR